MDNQFRHENEIKLSVSFLLIREEEGDKETHTKRDCGSSRASQPWNRSIAFPLVLYPFSFSLPAILYFAVFLPSFWPQWMETPRLSRIATIIADHYLTVLSLYGDNRQLRATTDTSNYLTCLSTSSRQRPWRLYRARTWSHSRQRTRNCNAKFYSAYTRARGDRFLLKEKKTWLDTIEFFRYLMLYSGFPSRLSCRVVLSSLQKVIFSSWFVNVSAQCTLMENGRT